MRHAISFEHTVYIGLMKVEIVWSLRDTVHPYHTHCHVHTGHQLYTRYSYITGITWRDLMVTDGDARTEPVTSMIRLTRPIST